MRKGNYSLNKLLKNTFIFALSNFSSKFLVFLLLPFYTRVLSPSDFGKADLIAITVSLLLPIFTVSVSEGILRFTMQKEIKKNLVFSFGLKIIFIGFIILIMLYPIFIYIEPVNKYIIVFYLMYITITLNQYLNQFLRGLGNIGLIGIVGVISTIITIVSNILLLFVYDFGIHGYLGSIIVTNIISIIILFIFGKLYKYLTTKSPNIDLKREMLSYNLPLIPNRMSWWVIMLSNRYVLNYFYGASIVGLFTAANRIPTIITTVYGVVQQALLLSVIEDYEEKKSYQLFHKVYTLMNVIMIISVLTVNISIKPLSYLLFGNEYLEAWKIVPYLAVSALFSSLHGNLTTVFSAVKQTKTLFVNSFIGALINLLLNIVFTPFFNVYGVVIASICTYVVVWFHLVLKSREYVGKFQSIRSDIACYLLVLLQSIIITTFQSSIYIFSITILLLILLIKNKEINLLISIFGELFIKLLKPTKRD